jgi:serine/threonine-protein kinase
MERVVALKIVNPMLVKNPGAVERFRREVRATAQLVHPNIVTAYDAETVDGTHFLVMEYVDGQSLAEVLAKQHMLPINQACEYLRQTSLGLQHALQHGMVHRDIKPQNLMLSVVSRQSSVTQDSESTDEPLTTDYLQIKILDFGLARFVREQLRSDEITECGTLMGSADYVAPEQVTDAHTADARADIYSMGCTLYHLLTGQVPFPGNSLLDKLEAHRDRQPRPLSQMRLDVPLELANVVAKMMAKNPAQRYQTPAEVALALHPFALTQSTVTQPSVTQSTIAQPTIAQSAQTRRPSGTKRYPIIALGVGLLLAAIGLLAPIDFFRVEQLPDSLSRTAGAPDVQLAPQSQSDAAQTASPETPSPPQAPQAPRVHERLTTTRAGVTQHALGSDPVYLF